MSDPIQDQFIAARRNQILAAAKTVFAEKGFHSATTKDIARQAGISEGTIYNYFQNKTALLIGIFELMQTTVQAEAVIPSPDQTDVRGLLTAYFRYPLMALKDDNFGLFRVVMSEIMVNPELRMLYHQRILEPSLTMTEAYFQQLVAQGLIKPVNIGLLVRAISGLIMGLILQYTMDDTTLAAEWDALPDVLAAIILDGIDGGEA